jgi:hypothetical protein
MSDNPLIEGFLKIHENEAKRKISGSEIFDAIGKAHSDALKGVRDAIGSDRVDKISAAARGAADNVTLGLGKYARAAVDTNIKNLGSLAGISEPTTFSKELEQEREKDTAAQQNQPAAWDVGDKAATAAAVATGIGGVAKTIVGAVAKKAARELAKSTAKTSKDFELGVGRLDLFPDEAVSSMRPPAQPSSTLNLTPQMRVPSTPASQAAPVSQTPLNLTPQMRVPGTRKVIPFRNTRLTTEEQNEPSKGNTEMSTNPFIKGFFDIEEARAKNTNIFDESKKLTAAQKKNLDKNDNDKIDAEDFKMLRKEEAIEEAKKPKPGHNAMVMARNVSKVLKAAKPDFLDIDKDGDKEEPMKKAAADMKKEEVEFSEEEMNFINSVMEAMPVAPTSEADSPNPTPKKKAEGSRAKGSMAD